MAKKQHYQPRWKTVTRAHSKWDGSTFITQDLGSYRAKSLKYDNFGYGQWLNQEALNEYIKSWGWKLKPTQLTVAQNVFKRLPPMEDDLAFGKSADDELCFLRWDRHGTHYLIIGDEESPFVSYGFVGRKPGHYGSLHCGDKGITLDDCIDRFLATYDRPGFVDGIPEFEAAVKRRMEKLKGSVVDKPLID
jgi:hypothetical protein